MKLSGVIGAGVNKIGVTGGHACPACGNMVSFHIINTFLTPKVFYIPVMKIRNKYVAVCPECASVMAVENGDGCYFSQDNGALIYTDNLRIIQNNCFLEKKELG